MHSVPVILSCLVSLETDWHISFLKKYPHPAPGDQRFEITMWGQKIKFFIPFHFGVSKMRLDERIPNLVSELK